LELCKYTLTEGFTCVTSYWYQRYCVIDIQQSVTRLRNNIFQRNSPITLAIYCKSSVQNVIMIRSDLKFLLYDL